MSFRTAPDRDSDRALQNGLSIQKNDPLSGISSAHDLCCYSRPQHFLYFLPLPQGHGAFRATLGFGGIASIGKGTWVAWTPADNRDGDSFSNPSSRSMTSRGARIGIGPAGSGMVDLLFSTPTSGRRPLPARFSRGSVSLRAN